MSNEPGQPEIGMTFEPYRLPSAGRICTQKPDCTPGRELASRVEGSGSFDFFVLFAKKKETALPAAIERADVLN
ncbi:hypothetical protein [Mucilaginibacter paludis]|uniref:Uncharacterized protein n=1 Tax=Mucilaginibacter paludis DSM 18603 TaxID=714943 RepID=H1YBS6_9SPHI|nr:hypothetical protein [Mucilaginibacter paludis]EHQ26039.1 hypothetical protein Mucpa_1892 [Mucilaginibacter paludis DSM 18603]